MQVALAQVVPYYVSFGPPKHRARTSGFRFRGAGAQFQCFPPIKCVLDPSAFFGGLFFVAGGAGGGFLLCMHLPYFRSSGVGPRVCGDVPCELLAIEQGIAKYTVWLFHVYPPGRLPVLDLICNAGEGRDGIHPVLDGVPSRPPGCLPPFHSVARGRGRSFSNLICVGSTPWTWWGSVSNGPGCTRPSVSYPYAVPPSYRIRHGSLDLPRHVLHRIPPD